MKSFKLLFTLCLSMLAGIALAQDIEVYVSDAGNFTNPPWQILKFDENGDNPEVFIDSELDWPQDIVFLEDQDVVLISSLSSGRITRHNVDNGDYIDDFANGIAGPTRMKIGDDDLLYVLLWQGNGKVQRYQQDGTFVDEFTDTGVVQSIGLDWDDSGNLYVSSFSGALVQEYNSSGVDQGTFINSNLSGPTNIWFDDMGNLLALDWSGGDVKKFDSDGNFLEVFITGLTQPEGIDFFPNGDILIGDGGNSAVNRYDSDGNFIEVFIGSGSGGLIQPNAVVIREINTAGLDDNKLSSVFVTPTVGSTFRMNTSILQRIDKLEVYSITGVLVDTINLKEGNIWNADSLTEGIYFMVANSNGLSRSQKIIVKK